MAYVERWWTSFKPLGQAVTYTVRIKEKDYAGGTSAIEIFGKEPLTVRNRGNEDFKIGAIIGTEIQFKFWITPEDGIAYDDLFTAVNRQFLFEIERDGALYFVGFMKTENISKTLFGRRHLVSLSGADGLAYLKDVPFTDLVGENYTDRVSYLTSIKRILEHTEHLLDITVKLGTYHLTDSLMLPTECALDKADLSSLRFYKERQGLLIPLSCYNVLQQLVGLFNCSIMQLNGTWYVFNNAEVDSFLFTFDWATLTQQSRVANNNAIDLNLYTFKSKGTLTYRPPLSKIEVTFENKYVDVNIVANGDFSGGLIGWTNGLASEAWDTFAVVSEELNCAIVGGFVGDRTFISNTFSVNEINISDIINFSIRSKVDTSFTYPTTLKAEITNTTTAQSVLVDLGFIGNKWQNHKGSVPIMGDGNYTIKIILKASEFMASNTEIRFDDVYLSVDYGGVNTTDKIITISNDDAIDENIEDYTTYIGDSQYINDQGCILIGGLLTSLWRTFGNIEDEPIIDLLGAMQLNARQTFIKYLRVNINDLSDNVNAGSIIELDGINYRIIRFNKKYNRMIADVDLLEMNT